MRIHKWVFTVHFSTYIYCLLQTRLVQPLKRWHQFDLLFMCFFECSAGCVDALCFNSTCRLVMPHSISAVKYGCYTNPLQCFCVSHCTKVMKMSVIIGNQKIQSQHFMDTVRCIWNAKNVTAMQKMMVFRYMVWSFLYFHHVSCTD